MTTDRWADLADITPGPGGALERWQTAPVPEGTTYDDSTVAEAFARRLAGRYLYCGGLGGWLRWDGRRWERDVTEAVHEEARRYVLDLGHRLAASDHPGDELRKVYALRSKGRLEAITTLARRIDGIAARHESFDSHADLLNCENGIVDLQTGQLGPHDPELRLTAVTSSSYHPEHTHSDVDKVLEVIEPDVRVWVQRLMGHALTGRSEIDLLPVFDGTGANGKTTLLEGVYDALGEYGWPADVRLIMGSDRDHKTAVASLRGKRWVWVDETPEGGSLSIEVVKKLTGGSTLTARFLYRDEITWRATHTLAIATNHRPAVNATDHAAWRRLRLIPFPFRYSDAERARPGDRVKDPELRTRLRGEQQRNAMLQWLVQGAIDWHREGMPACPQIDQATEAWRDGEDVVRAFLRDVCVLGEGASVRSSDLFEAWEHWCKGEGRTPGSLKVLTRRLEGHDMVAESGAERRRTSSGVAWFGLGLASSTEAHQAF